MQAKIHPRIRLQRPQLEQRIPLDVPFIINVDPSDRCNLQCKFCPTGDHDLMRVTEGRNHGPMKFDLFKKVVDDICHFERPVKVLRLYKDGEPLSNPRFADMVRYAKEKNCSEAIDTTTNAILLTRKMTDDIIEAGLDRMNISIYGMSTDQYVEFSGRKVRFDELVRNIRYLYENGGDKLVINIKINSDVVPGATRDKFYQSFGDICHEINDEHVMSCWSGFDYDAHGVEVNQTVGIYGQTLPSEVLVCPYVFYSFSINSDGTASTCFLDWDRQRRIGDTKTESVVDIWHGAQLRAWQEMMLRGERKNSPLCGSCGQLTHGSPDNIDPYREELLAKLVQIQTAAP
ncbi:MAG: radical SAM protein [Candidatus Zambryskibacteria bacterium CG10_big_fil_rev_8_21_14_0_10_42_12]|uniref:Radical SAM protein n=1 Tax=Candidatus Zambryskibacteria bacterium CG10_big_fil_rev_8_21_14_0_10_42_12 TaxID=1975115 RepID=A0A2H0QX51_9BACT|nr:MAG: radical SAM protein [Candidatus Zambryskibacteria bacterium CG10_big_fil_rev_8_21_14_0_10_42_12]